METNNSSIDITQDDLCHAIKSIVWGYLLLHLGFNLGALDLLPDWLGYLLFLSVIPVLAMEDESTRLLRPFGILLALWEGLRWVAALIGISLEEYTVGIIVALIVVVISLYFHFQLLTNLANIAEKYNCPEQRRILNLRTVKTLLGTLFAFPLPWQNYTLLAIPLLILNAIVAILICSVLGSLRRSLMENTQ